MDHEYAFQSSKAYFCFNNRHVMRLFSVFLACILFVSCHSSKKEIVKTHSFTNDLIHESSPYLLQHAHNPVNWKPYGQQALQQAKEERKLMVISIGYAACHWCHVMEHESFEDSTVAAVMNDNFISIKVDREERPDVDQIYINAVQLMTGRAGWPLNVVTLPDGRPIWGGTYFRKNDWINALEQIEEMYRREPQKLLAYANRLEEGLKSMDLVQLNEEAVDFSKYDTAQIVSKLSEQLDYQNGGFKGAPKFMMPNILEFLLRYVWEKKDAPLKDYMVLTLNKMAYGGLYDQIGGGFARYSTDEKWHVPHFEKMLYDNAQLVSLYSRAYLVTQKPLYKQVVEKTLAFIRQELTNEEGGFYSSLDADSETANGRLEEGAYYVFTSEELKTLLKDDFSLFKAYFNINSYGKWENDKYVLIRNKSDAEFEEEFEITPKQLRQKKKKWRNTLLAYRNQRQKPRLDDKTLTSWNAMMLKGYIDAYKAFGKEEYLKAALQNARFLANRQLQDSGALFHTYKNGKSSVPGFLEDYAFCIEAFIDLYQITLDENWLNRSNSLANYTLEHFLDHEKKMFYFTSKLEDAIVTRNFEYRDNVVPASNSVMAKNLFRLSKYFGERSYGELSQQMLKNVLAEIAQYPSGFSNWLDLLLNLQGDFFEVVVVGPEAQEKIKTINSHYLPNIIVAGSKGQAAGPLFENRFVPNRTLIYVCVNNSCKLPVEDTQKAIESIN